MLPMLDRRWWSLDGRRSGVADGPGASADEDEEWLKGNGSFPRGDMFAEPRRIDIY